MAIPVVLAVAFALQNIACGSTSMTIANESGTVVFIHDSFKSCNELDVATLDPDSWTTIQPNSEKSIATLRDSRCFAVQTLGGRLYATADFYENSRYVITVSGDRVNVERDRLEGETEIGQPDGRYRRFVLVSSIAGTVIFLGMLGGGLFIVRLLFSGDERFPR